VADLHLAEEEKTQKEKAIIERVEEGNWPGLPPVENLRKGGPPV